MRILSGFFLVAAAQAAPPSWSFNPQKAGRALYEGGWMAEYSLGRIDASPEFSFNLQLIYWNGRQQKGLFGSQFFCPQLESTIIPRGTDLLVWTIPSGRMLGFKPDAKRSSEYVSMDGNWRANVKTTKQVVYNEEGWEYAYSRGRLEGITSPTGRLLEFLWKGNNLSAVQIRDVSTNARRVLVKLAYRGKRIAVMEVNGRQHKFGYRSDGPDDRLVVYGPPVGREIRFFYDSKSGILAGSQVGKGKDDITEFATVFVKPFDGDKPGREQTPQRNPKNYWIAADRDFQYAYGVDPKIKDRWLADQVSLEGKTGLKRQVSFSGKRGIVTARQGDAERKTYYYRAPGQKYDGKLRRVEENGQLKAEYRYDRRTGLITEMMDASGVITFFDYPADWRPQRKELWEPKPIRVRRGSRSQNEIVAEFAYDDDGRLLAARDAAGNLTRYAYTPRGEVASILDAAGGRTDFTYDSFGRRTSVAKNGIEESVEYDSLGRVAARIAPDGSRTDFAFDKTGLLSKVSRGDQAVIEYARDANGFVIGEKDAVGRLKKVERDARGNLLAETAPNGSVTRYEYDDRNRRTAQIDGNGNKITFAYDLAGRLAKQVNPLGGTLTWTYDDRSRLLERANGEQIIKYTYDQVTGKLTLLDYGAGQTIAYQYDLLGRVVSAATPATRFEYIHDKLGRVEAARLVHGGEEQLLRYRYDPRGRRTGLVLAELIPAVRSSGSIAGKAARYETLAQIDYAYNAAGRLESIVCNGQPIATYRTDSAGRPAAKSFGNGITTAISYDSMSRLGKMEFSGGPLGGSPTVLAYEWDMANQVSNRAWNGQVQRYEYDPSGQLLKVIDDQTGEALEAYAYDKAGNMLEKIVNGEKTAMTYNAANQLTSVASASLPIDSSAQGATSSDALVAASIPYHYDKAGRMLGASGGAVSAYGWLDKVVTLTRPDGTQIAYEYWPDGQLASKRQIEPQRMQISQNIQETAADGIQRISNPSVTSAPSAVETYLWDGLALLRRGDTIYINEPHPSGGAVIASFPKDRPQDLTFYLNDLLGTTLATVNGGAVQFAKLTAFGQPLKLPTATASPKDLVADMPANSVPQTESIPPMAP